MRRKQKQDCDCCGVESLSTEEREKKKDGLRANSTA